MIEALHIQLTDKDIEKLRNGEAFSFDFNRGELREVMQILIMRETGKE